MRVEQNDLLEPNRPRVTRMSIRSATTSSAISSRRPRARDYNNDPRARSDGGARVASKDQDDKAMKSDQTLVLIGEAKRGDRDAWAKVLELYYDRWLRKYHGDLGSTVGRLYDTQDLVQSAVGDAIRDIPDLRSEAAFFSLGDVDHPSQGRAAAARARA